MKLILAMLMCIGFIGRAAYGKEIKMPHVTGIGGVFFKSKDNHKALAEWYQKHLGIKIEPWGGAVFRWQEDEAKDKGVIAWNIAEKDTNQFSPSESSFMINYRVSDLNGIVTNLKKDGIKIIQGPESTEYGKFAWILDPEGNKIELWEP